MFLSRSIGFEGYRRFNRRIPNQQPSLLKYRGGAVPRINLGSNDPMDFRCIKHSDYLSLGLDSSQLFWTLESQSTCSSLVSNRLLQSAIDKFYIALCLWETTTGNKWMNRFWYFTECLDRGPEFAKFLKSVWDYSLRKFLGYDYPVPEGQLWVKISSYNSIFPYRFLIHWEEETNDVEEWMTIPITYEQEFVDKVKIQIDSFLESLPDTLERVNDEEIFNEVKTSMSYDSFEKKPHFSIEDNRFCDKMVAYRTKVQVAPAGVRDTFILQKSSSNTIRWIEKQIGILLDFCPESLLGSKTNFESKMLQFYDARGSCVMRDIKKCGLTIPLQVLLPYLIQRLSAYYPDIPWNRLDIYNNIYIHSENSCLRPLRGIGLGMGNHITTLLLIMVHRATLSQLSCEMDHKVKCLALIGNDDSFVSFEGINGYDLAQSYFNIEKEIYRGIGGITNERKSFVSPHGILFEEYTHPDFHAKEALWVCGLSLIPYLPPILRRRYINSISYGVKDDNTLSRIISLLLPIDPDYASVPYEYGGYITYLNNDGSNQALDYICQFKGDMNQRKRIAENEVNINFISSELTDIDIGDSTNTYFPDYSGPPIKYGESYIIISKHDRKKFYQKVRKYQYSVFALEKELRRLSFKRILPEISRKEFFYHLYKNYNVCCKPCKYTKAIPFNISGAAFYERYSDYIIGCLSLLSHQSFPENKSWDDLDYLCSHYQIPFWQCHHTLYDPIGYKAICSYYSTSCKGAYFVPVQEDNIASVGDINTFEAIEFLTIAYGLRQFVRKTEVAPEIIQGQPTSTHELCEFHKSEFSSCNSLLTIPGQPGCCELGALIQQYCVCVAPQGYDYGADTRVQLRSMYNVICKELLRFRGNPNIELMISDALMESESEESDMEFDIF